MKKDTFYLFYGTLVLVIFMMEEILCVCQELNIGNQIIKIEKVSGGLLHEMFCIRTDQGIYAVKKLNPKVMKRKEAYQNFVCSEKFSRKVIQKGVPGIHALGDKKFLFHQKDHYYMIFPWLNGRILTFPEVKEEHVIKVAESLAKMHLISSQMGTKASGIPSSKMDFEKYKISSVSYGKIFDEIVDTLSSMETKIHLSLIEINKKAIMSHCDLDLKNVMWDEKENPYFIDFESASYVNMTFDLLDVALYWSGIDSDFCIDYFDLFIDSYLKINPHIEDDVKVVGNCLCIHVLGWLRYNLELTLQNSKDQKAFDEVQKSLRTLKNYMEIVPQIINHVEKKLSKIK